MSCCLPVTSHTGGGSPPARGARSSQCRRGRRLGDPPAGGGLGSHVARGATIARDRRRACNGLARDAGAVSEPHKSDVRDPEYWEKMARPSTTSAHGPRDVSGASRGCPWAACRAISTGASIPFASTRQVTDGPKPLDSQRLMTWREDRSPDARTRPSAWG